MKIMYTLKCYEIPKNCMDCEISNCAVQNETCKKCEYSDERRPKDCPLKVLLTRDEAMERLKACPVLVNYPDAILDALGY